MSFLGEIKRRKVFQVAVAYAVVAWLVVQVITAVEAPLLLPDWFDTGVIVLLALGFPVAVILAWAFDLTPEGVVEAESSRPVAGLAPARGQQFGFAMQGLVLLAVGFLVLDQFLWEPEGFARDEAELTGQLPEQDALSVRRFRTSLGDLEPIADGILRTDIAVSPDGRSFVYVDTVDGQAQLFYRSLDQFEAQPMPGTEGALRPFFSPDGEWVGFYSDQTDQQLKKVSVRGGVPFTLTDAPLASGADWSVDDTILYVTGDSTAEAVNGRSLFRISANGGAPEIILQADQEKGYGNPHVLPDGEAALVAVRLGVGGAGRADQGHIDLLSLTTGESRTIIEAGFAPKYTASGHIVFYRGDGLWAVPFDLARLQTTGPEVAVLGGIQTDNLRGYVPYAITEDGLLIYVEGEVGVDTLADSGLSRTLIWVDRAGNEELVADQARRQVLQRVSPDGQQIALSINLGSGWDIWVTDLARGTSSRVTFDSGDEIFPIWSSDGQRVAFFGIGGIGWVSADGTGQSENIFSGAVGSRPLPITFLPDGNLAFIEGTRVRILSVDDGSITEPLLVATPTEYVSAISPDGNWIAYESIETGEYEIYVRPFPNVDGGKWQISVSGGESPRWSPDGGEVFFWQGDTMMAVPVDTDPVFSSGAAVALFEGNYGNGTRANYDVSPDGERFLMLPFSVNRTASIDREDVYLAVVDNWFEELRRLAPPGQ